MAQRLRSARNATLRALDRMSLLEPVYHAYERVRSLRGSEDGEVDADGLPVPPPRLRVEVAGTAGLEWFLDSGRQQAGIIRSAAERNGAPLESAGSLLDFGCGCGRVLRHWAGLEGPAIHGSDFNERLVGWCAANLPFVTASVNELEPPLRYDDEQFDLVYAISVFTHLPHDLERAWIDELSRIMASRRPPASDYARRLVRGPAGCGRAGDLRLGRARRALARGRRLEPLHDVSSGVVRPHSPRTRPRAARAHARRRHTRQPRTGSRRLQEANARNGSSAARVAVTRPAAPLCCRPAIQLNLDPSPC